ncbi:MAG: cell division protein FtsZ [Proteobacteria bacterium]|nr:cell division protein FtsZ [Pseudomonadota bacterium]
MAINLKATEPAELRPRITVLGVGGAGGNAVNNMISSKLEGVEFVVANTDAQALAQSKAERRIQLGVQTTEGQGAGAIPDVGRAGAEENLDEVMEHLAGSHMVFITAGMGGGTGTGAAPVIARAVRERGILTVGVVTKPFAFEGDKRMRAAERGIAELQQYVHTLIVIPNQNLFRVANDRTTFAQAFSMADEVLHAGVRGITDLIVMPGLINLDFADIKSVITEMGKAMMGTGEAEGEDRAQKAADMAISNPLLDDVSMKGARGVLINITGGPDLMLFEVEQAANRIRAEVDPDANIIFGNTILDDMEGRIRVSVVATGIDAEQMRLPEPKIQPIRAGIKPLATKPEIRPEPAIEPVRPTIPAAASATINPVHRQYETIAGEMGAEIASRTESPAEAMILGGEDAPEIYEDVSALSPVIRSAPIQRIEPQRAPQPQPEPERRIFGLFGRKKKDEPRLEPAQPRTAPRATAQPMVPRVQQPAPAQPPQNLADDLFPEHKRDEQFEIPAFLRRQSN